MTRKWARFDSETLSSPADDLILTDQLSGETGKEHSEFLAHDFATGGTIFPRQQYNGDTASNYSARVSLDGAGDVAVGSVPQINWDVLGINPADHFVRQSTINLSAQEKLVMGNSMSGGIIGAGSAPFRRINAYKWVNTASQITSSRYFDAGGTGQFATTTNFAAFMAIDQAIARFASMRESFDPLTAEFKQHFIDWFSGATLDSIWNFSFAGTASVAMTDAINEGLTVTASNGTGEINFNLIRPFEFNSSVFHATWRPVSTTNQNIITGFSDSITFAAVPNTFNVGHSTSIFVNNWNIQTGDGTSNTNVSSSNTVNFVFNNWKLELLSASAEASVNGVLDSTVATNLPIFRLQPVFFANGVGKSGRIRYIEVFNK
jgi:hypothetical protein